MYGVEFKVSEAGRQRVLRKRRKNVHAGVVGYLCSTPMHTYRKDEIQVTYNPYRDETFVKVGYWAPIFKADGAYLTRNKKVYAYV
jgi:hypothetical protein